jgi:glycosyltransferase involved in cell wall biosynthesis
VLVRPGITVITPSIPPRRHLLAVAVASVAEQTLLPDAHIVSIDHKAEGQVAIRNRAIEACDTEWIAFLDDDDRFLPNHLRALAMHQETTGADLVYPWFNVEGGTDPLGAFGKPFDPEGLESANYIPVTHLCRTELAKDVGGFPLCPEEWHDEGCADWGFLLRLKHAGAKFAHLPEITWVWRHHAANTSGRPWRAA